MRTLYKVVPRTKSCKTVSSNELFDRATVAQKVRELNARYSRKGVEFIAEAVDLSTLSSWQLTRLFQLGKVSYDELLKFAGLRVAERAKDPSSVW